MHERVRDGDRATSCVCVVVRGGFVCVCDGVRIECVCVCMYLCMQCE